MRTAVRHRALVFVSVLTALAAACGGDNSDSNGPTTPIKVAHGGGKSGSDGTGSAANGSGANNGAAANGSGANNGAAANGSGSDDGAAANGSGSDNGAAANGSGSDNGAAANGNGSDSGSDDGAAANGSGANGSGANGSGDDGGAGKGGGSEGDGIDHGALTKIEILPDFSTITVVEGKASALPLQVFPIYADMFVGKAIVAATWSVDQGDVATVDGNGNVTATGFRGADVIVTAAYKGLTATSTASVKLVVTFGAGDLSDADRSLLDGAETNDPTAKVLYPYDGTAFPRGLAGPRVMWGGGSTADVMSLTLNSDWLQGTYYFHASAPHALEMPAQLWTLFTESGAGTQPATMRLARATSGGTATVIANQKWQLAAGSLRGTVYYWANNLGRVVRIKPGAAEPDDFLSAAGVSDGCTTCHSVSARGNVLTLGGGIPGDSMASVFDLGAQSVSASNRGRTWAMLALNPNGTVAALNNAPLPGGPGQTGGLYSVATGVKFQGTGADDVFFDMPSFAPDSSKLVYVDHTTHGLATFDFTDSDTAPKLSGQVEHLSGDSGDPIAFPSVSPDGNFAIYHRGSLDTRSGNGDLFLASITDSGTEFPLDALNGKGYPFAFGDRDLHLNYEPTFLPVEAGDFFWVVFTSRRTLGNQLVGDRTQVKQLWVAAIEKNPTPGLDPSHAPFWVPGQEPTTLNMRGFWALDGCKSKGVACEQTSECCGGAECLPSSHTCDQAAASTCAAIGADCLQQSDCCGFGQGYGCAENRCQLVKE